MIKEIELHFGKLTESMENLKSAINEITEQENEMITEIKVGDYIEKSELDTEQKYNDVVEVFEQWGFTGYMTANDYVQTMNDAFQLIFIKDNRFMLCSHAAEIQRKLTYNDIMSLKKVDVDNCNVDKLVSGGEVDVSVGPFKTPDTTEKIIFDDHFKPKSNRVSTVNRDLEGQMQGKINSTINERGNNYGKFKDGADIMQELKSVMRSTPNWHKLTPSQREALEMIQHKIGRILNGNPSYTDSWHDIQGYAKLVEDELNGEVK